MQNLYWIVLLNISIIFLNFIYELLNKKRDFTFFLALVLNTCTTLVRYFLELDYSQTNYWRFRDIKTATFMAAIFSFPMIWAIILIIVKYKTIKEVKIKKQLRYLLYGITFATLISIFSEYIGPIFIPEIETYSFMYIAILTLFLFLINAVVKEKFLNVELEYIYEELFVNSSEGIILIDEDKTIVSVNNAIKKILGTNKLEKGIVVNDIIKDYDFDKDNIRYEITIKSNDKIYYLSLSQDKIKIDNKATTKLLHIINITPGKVREIIEKNKLNEKSIKDELTSLFNKRYFNDNFVGESHLLEKNTIVMFIDVDNFKEINDNYGHLIGDDVLKGVALSITSSLRKNEIAIRYGGDEFLIILPKTKIQDAFKIAERIRVSVNNNVLKNHEINQKLTLSIGLSKGDNDINNLVEQADKAMYYSKTHGKNQCTLYNKNKLT